MAAKYAAIYFGKDETDKWREFLRAMNTARIIELTKEEIDANVKEFASIPYGTTNHLVLHDEAEVHLFEHAMKVFFPNKEYEITDKPGSLEFGKWLSEKEKAL